MNGAVTLQGGPFQNTLPAPRADLTSPDYNSEDFQSELFPLHSPLLRESWLVSFPPPSYMLKFSGYSCLIGGPKWIECNTKIVSCNIRDSSLSEEMLAGAIHNPNKQIRRRVLLDQKAPENS